MPKVDTGNYWAAAPVEGGVLAGEIDDKISKYYANLISTGRVEVWRRAYRLLYGWAADGSYKSSRYVTFSGEEGEVVNASANLIRSFTKAMHTQATGSRQAFSCRSTADDSRAAETVKVGNALLDYYWTENGFEAASSQAVWWSLPSGEGWLYPRWDHYAGKPIGVTYPTVDVFDPLTGETKQEEDLSAEPIGIKWSGDMAITALKPEDVIRDIHRNDADHDWLIVSTLANRWDLAARYPDYRQECINAAPPAQWTAIRSRLPSSTMWREAETDVVPVFELWHKRTDALPAGRHCLWIDGTVIFDEPMKYQRLPVVPMIPSLEVDSPYGYGETWDLLNLQQAITSMITQLVSTRENFGARNIWSKPGVRVSSSQVTQGFKIVESEEKPEVLDFGQGYVGEVSQAYDLIKSAMQIQTGMNDTVLGDASKSQSGEALRMLHSMAMQYNSGLMAARGAMNSAAMTVTLDMCKENMTGEQMVPIMGRGETTTIKRFKAEDLGALDSVRIQMDNPTLNTAAGRLDLADKFFAAQAIDPAQYMQVAATGRLEAAFDRPASQRLLIDSENELLRAGTPVRAMATDDHALHIREHTVVMNDPEVRINDQLAMATVSHLAEHYAQWTQITMTNPALLAATGQQPAPMPPPPPMPGMVDPNTGAPVQPNPSVNGGAPMPGISAGGPGGAGMPAMDPNIPPAPINPMPEAAPTTMA